VSPHIAFNLANVLSIAGDLLVAALLGGVIGAQRQATHKPAGFRTHLLVALGSCAFMEASRLSGDTRIGAGIITGIGFLGAGSIVREGLVTKGLTTAASIWAVAAVGLSLGFGTPIAYVLAALTTVLVLVALSLTDKRLERVFPPRDAVLVAITFDLAVLTLDQIHALFEGRDVHPKRTEQLCIVREDGGKRVATWRLALHGKHVDRLTEALVVASGTPGVERIEAIELTNP